MLGYFKKKNRKIGDNHIRTPGLCWVAYHGQIGTPLAESDLVSLDRALCVA